VVPHTIYPDTYSATASSRLNWLITTKLRENALILRELVNESSTDSALMAKAKMMEEIYGAMVLAFGRPPKPNETFEWTYTDKDGKYHRVTSTPREFYKSSGFKADEHFSLINDPRNKYNTLYTVDRLKNSNITHNVFNDSIRGTRNSLCEYKEQHHEIRCNKDDQSQ